MTNEILQQVTRRHFFSDCRVGLGALALGQFLGDGQRLSASVPDVQGAVTKAPHFPPRAKSVIYLFMAGAPSQFELFDYKPELQRRDGETAPDSLFPKDKSFAFIGKGATLLGTRRKFAKRGECGMEISELLPHTAAMADELCWIKGMKTDVFNHGPAKLFMNTGFQVPGRPSFGSWVVYGIGSEAEDLPGFVVLQSGPRGPRAGNALWSSGFLPTNLQGVPFRGTGDAILNLHTPAGLNKSRQREFVDLTAQLNQERLRITGDPEIATRISAYEMAFRMQTSAPELMDLAQEPAHVLTSYGAEPGKNSFANNCLLARRLVERGVRFVQLYHTDWDDHGGPNENLGEPLERRCRQVDQSCAALVQDLKSRGMLEDTIVIWGGEFGRTPMGEIREGIPGRDHHVEAFTMWLAGGGFKPGHIQGATDDLGYYTVDGQVHVHDLHATLLNQLGFDHERLTFRFQGRDHRLTDVFGTVRRELLA
ncbi:MAG TPA: DUF1501 domain-containing protein [Pirellulales bacterium]|jgi:hypothetical protein